MYTYVFFEQAGLYNHYKRQSIQYPIVTGIGRNAFAIRAQQMKGKNHTNFYIYVRGRPLNRTVFFYLHKLQIEANSPTHPSICITDMKKILTPCLNMITTRTLLTPQIPHHILQITP